MALFISLGYVGPDSKHTVEAAVYVTVDPVFAKNFYVGSSGHLLWQSICTNNFQLPTSVTCSNHRITHWMRSTVLMRCYGSLTSIGWIFFPMSSGIPIWPQYTRSRTLAPSLKWLPRKRVTKTRTVVSPLRGSGWAPLLVDCRWDWQGTKPYYVCFC